MGRAGATDPPTRPRQGALGDGWAGYPAPPKRNAAWGTRGATCKSGFNQNLNTILAKGGIKGILYFFEGKAVGDQ
jgi:hypothetical protein